MSGCCPLVSKCKKPLVWLMCEAAPWPGPGYIVYYILVYTGWSQPPLWTQDPINTRAVRSNHWRQTHSKSKGQIFCPYFAWFSPNFYHFSMVWPSFDLPHRYLDGYMVWLPSLSASMGIAALGSFCEIEEGAALWHYDGHSRQLGAGLGPHLALCQCNLTPPCGEQQSWQHSFQITTNVSCLCLQFM